MRKSARKNNELKGCGVEIERSRNVVWCDTRVVEELPELIVCFSINTIVCKNGKIVFCFEITEYRKNGQVKRLK